MQKRRPAILIAGAGHSGSTLLGLILGSNSQAFYAGEAKKVVYLGDETKPERKRVCKLCGGDCKVWGTFPPTRGEQLYDALRAQTGKATIVDSSKSLAWLRARIADEEASWTAPVLLFLQRDGRAVFNSRVRKYPDRDPVAVANKWAGQVESTMALYEQHGGPRMVVRYEELATEPERVVREICELAQLSWEPGMLDFASHEHHVLGGNNGTQFQVARAQELQDDTLAQPGDRHGDYYHRHPSGIALDLRWRTELPAHLLTIFESVAAGTNQTLRWKD
jgi:hypothetical protein